MRIAINPVWDMETLAIVRHDGSYEYTGPFLWCKGGDQTVKTAEKTQAGFDQQLMNIFQQQYGAQSAITKYLTQQLEPNISKGGQGMSPEALAAARTQSTDTLSNQFQGAQRAINATESRDLPSGVNAQVAGSLQAQQAEAQASGQNQITAQNEALKQNNYWNSISALSGNAAQMNPLGYAGGATSGGNTMSGLSEANTDAYKNSFTGALSIGLGGGIGGALGKAVGVGAGTALFG